MVDHVLGHLARRFTVSEENLATEALTWLLRDPSANSALCSLARAVGARIPDGLTFVGQVGSPDTGRPDIVGTDENQRVRLLIEAKFAAGLTAQQPRGYLTLLGDAAPGLLLVVAPSARLGTLWSELLHATPETAASAPSPSAPLEGDLMRTAVGGNRVLALASWRHVVTHILEALNASGNRPLAQDAEQLLALTEVMDSQAYAPVRPGDYGPGEARRVQQLQGLIDGVRDRARQSDRVEQAGRSSHGRIFYGWYLRSRATSKSLWFGFLPRLWDREGISPLWMQVKTSSSWSRQRLAQALAPLHGAGQQGVFEGLESFYVPLALQPFLSQRETVVDLLSQVEAVVALLDAAVAPGEEPTADEIPASEEIEDDDPSNELV
jgi:hypothetical protein